MSSQYTKADRGYETECHIYSGLLDKDGYPAPGLTNVLRGVGDLRKGERHHLCFQRDCIRPDHIEVVSRAVNVRESSATKLTDDDLRAIRAMVKQGRLTYSAIGAQFGVTTGQVSRIVRDKSWREPQRTPTNLPESRKSTDILGYDDQGRGRVHGIDQWAVLKAVACPTCGAPVGKWCNNRHRRRKGTLVPKNHAARMSAAAPLLGLVLEHEYRQTKHAAKRRKQKQSASAAQKTRDEIAITAKARAEIHQERGWQAKNGPVITKHECPKCGGNHHVKDCTKPKVNIRAARAKKQAMA
jgi:predicted RNA-binding Zn-ribbon protein involved in translation (DUF1610 family)